jgi:hypothetical protein
VEDFAYYAASCFAGLVYLVVGVRLFALSSRNGQVPDRLLTVSFLFWALCYLLYDIPLLVYRDPALIPPLYPFGVIVTYCLGSAVFAIFTRAVFRSREIWARWLLAGIVGCLLVGLGGCIWVGDWAGEYPLSHPWWWVKTLGITAPFAWMSAEGFTQFVKSRKRQRLGLCSPMVANRFLLWGLSGLLWSILEFVETAQYVIYQSTGAWADSLSYSSAWLEAVPGGLIWLIFFPPSRYRNWITQRPTRAGQAAEGAPDGG